MLGAAPTVVAIALLFVASWSDGAFQLRSWAPLAVFALVAVAVGPRSGLRGAGLAMVACMAGLAAWALVSSLWSATPGAALEGGARAALYAGLVALPLLTLPSRRSAVAIAKLLCAAAAAIIALSLAACLVDGPAQFVAGRLDDPVGYRNGSAALFALCAWLLVAVAAHRRIHALLRAGAFALAVTAIGLAFLTQSRGVVIGFACGGVVALALGPDRLRRAWLAILAVGAVAISSDALLDPFQTFEATRTAPSPAVIEGAVRALATVSAAGFVVALLLALFDGGLRMSSDAQRVFRTVAAVLLAVLTVGVLAGGLAVIGDPVALAREKASEFKNLEGGAPGETRLGDTSGQRYDLWRISLADFRSAPVKGAGEGAYPVRYYAERQTDRNVSTPHSLPLEVLGQLGAVGALLLAGFFVAAATALIGGWRSASESERRWASALAAAGAVVLGQSVVDWLWQIPGLTGLGLMCLATAVAIVALPRTGVPPNPGAVRRVAGVAGRVTAALAAILVAALFLSDVYTRGARATDISSQVRLDRARTAERLNPAALPPLLLQAGALEELGRRGQARRTLREALDEQPESFTTMALLGDLETRAGNGGAARTWYRRALARNPRDVGLQQLAGR